MFGGARLQGMLSRRLCARPCALLGPELSLGTISLGMDDRNAIKSSLEIHMVSVCSAMLSHCRVCSSNQGCLGVASTAHEKPREWDWEGVRPHCAQLT